eukprot:CAMPEP_0195605400 /NCGR_PEP_ID=MMETSP0815-20121206/7137_1 /TAXON_ID=97485 /ORGANISM="Prymnesium parvum, Strain Texoma1" /LENGTH=51 /DNA_ID=CAMNT_0040745083 /DNA_START=530 /DNA_END=682 /DNA_ORIENTATION=+
MSIGLLSATDTAPPIPPERNDTHAGARFSSHPREEQSPALILPKQKKRTAT